MALVLLGDRDDEAEVRVHHPVLRGLVSALDPLGQRDLLLRREQRVAPGLVEEELEGVGRVDREVAVHVRALAGLRVAAVVRELDAALVELGVERLEGLVLELELLRQLVERREVDAAVLLPLLDERRQLIGDAAVTIGILAHGRNVAAT